MSTGLPVTPTLFDKAIELVEAEADRAIIHSRQVAGFEFAALMHVGGELRHGGTWRTITAIDGGPKPRTILLTLDGGTQVVAAMLGMRRYREQAAA